MSWHKPAVAALVNPRASTIFKAIVWRWQANYCCDVPKDERIGAIRLDQRIRWHCNIVPHLLDDSMLLKHPQPYVANPLHGPESVQHSFEHARVVIARVASAILRRLNAFSRFFEMNFNELRHQYGADATRR